MPAIKISIPARSADLKMPKYILFVYTEEFVELRVSKKHNLDFLEDCEILYFEDPNKYIFDRRKKIAVVTISEEIYPTNYVFPLIRDLSSIDLIVVHSREDVFKTREVIEKEIYQSYNNKNFCVLAGGIDYRTYSADYFYPLLTHFKLTYEASDNSQYRFTTDRDFLFDCLLGTPKPSREYIYYRLIEDNLLDKSLVSITVSQEYYRTEHYNDLWKDISQRYRDKYNIKSVYKSDTLKKLDLLFDVRNDEEIDVNHPDNSLFTAINSVIDDNDQGHPYWKRIYITPYNVYNHSWYSIISETYQDHRFQPTEKTAKAFLGGRIFVAFCCHNFLKNLKKIGFLTFDSIIDESYDEIEDIEDRFDRAWKQVLFLSNSDHRENYQKVKKVLDHNRSILLDPKFQLADIERYIYKNAENLQR